uniref:hypothetical protein n=1 Tax=Rheinheimera sp. TaxID=1869214 RepID=UPI0040472D28
MNWGLLQGIGAGLSQGADIVSRGMAEDRNARREDERYQSQISREDARYADQVSREDARIKTESDRWERTFAQQAKQNEIANARAVRAEKRQAERDNIIDERYGSEKRIGQVNSELGKIFTDYNATASAISQEAQAEIKLLQSQTQLLARAQKSADPLAILQEGGMEGVPPESIGSYINDMNQRIQQINEAKAQRLQELESDRDTLLAGAKAYYGKDIEQSNFAAFLNQQGLSKERTAEINTLSQTNDAVVIGAQLFGGEDKAKPESSTDSKPESSVPSDPNAPGFGFSSGFKSGLKASMADEGSYFSNLQAENRKYTPDNTSPVGQALHPIGGLLGSVVGFASSAAGDIYNIGIKATETPNERKARLEGQRR